MVKLIKSTGKPERSKPFEREGSEPASESGGVTVTKSGWVSPRYNDSRSVTLDRKHVERNRCLGLFQELKTSDPYKVLRTRIQQRMRENGWNTLMVTSVHPGEGKTTISINLAAMFAKEFHQTVLLVDADLRSQSIHRYLGIESDRGLVDYLLNDYRLRDIIVWPDIEKFTLISGGRTIEDSTEVLNSHRMKSLVHEMKHRYMDRCIFFDVPPLLGRADAMAFCDMVDGIVMVVASGQTPMPDVQKALDLIPREKFLGFIMNHEDP